MFEAIRSNKRITQVILAIIIVPFAFFGMDAYFSGGPGGGDVASVGDYNISVAEFDQALRSQQDRMRQSMGSDVDSSVFRSNEFRRAVLDNLINRQLLAMHAADHRISVPEQMLQQAISEVPAFEGEDGRFSLQRYESVLNAQGMSPSQFESSMAQDLRVQQLVDGVSGSAIAGRTPVKQLMLAQLEERDVDELRFRVSELVDEVTVDEEALRSFYDDNTEMFELPPRLRAEYVVFDEEAMLAQTEVDEDAVRERYEARQEQYGQPEQRRVRHILIRVDDEGEAEQARGRAEEILAQLREDPDQFETLARDESEDSGSARDGGDLGYFGRGAMVSEFEEAAFGLDQGEISEPVRTDFGYHLIEITGIQEATVQPFDEVREEIERELKRDEAARQYPVLAEQFANAAYEQPDSLEGAAEPLGLEIRTSDWIEQGHESLNGIEYARLIEALFSEEVLELRENTEAFEVERGTMVAARVAEYEDTRQQDFDEVRDEIEQLLREERAAELARTRGEEQLEALKAGDEEADWQESMTLQRGEPALSRPAMQAVFSLPADDLPAYVGVQLDDGDYAIYRVNERRRPDLSDDDPRLQMLGQQYDVVIAELDFEAFLDSLREHYGVEINASTLHREERR